MARPREFDTDKALERAMDVFWAHGYENASLPMLLSGMKLTRGSLYKAFTDKKSLFLAALEKYETKAVVPAVQLLTAPDIPDGLIRIETLLTNVVESVRNGDRRGCLLCTAAAGPSAEDPDIAGSMHALVTLMQSGFEEALGASALRETMAGEQRQAMSAQC